MTHSDDLQIDLDQAIGLYRCGDTVAAERHLQDLLRLHPHHADVLCWLGVLANQCARHGDAADYLARAKAAGAASPSLYHHLGIAHHNLGRPQEAMAALREGIARLPAEPQLHATLGSILEACGRLDEADVSYRAALDLEPDAAGVHNQLGNLLLRQGRLEAAETAFQAAVRAAPGLAASHNNLGAVLCRQGRIDAGRNCFAAALDAQPDYVDALVNLGNAHYHLGDFSAARLAYERALVLNPGLPGVHNNLGSIQYRALDYGAAESSFRQALALAPGYVESHNNLANTLAQQGKVEEAKDLYRRSLQIDPSQRLLDLRVLSLCPTVFASTEAIDTYRERLLVELQAAASQGLQVEPDELVRAGLYPPYGLMYHGRDDLPLKQAYAALFRDCFPRLEPLRPNGRPRVGLVVTEGHEGIFLRSLAGVIERLGGVELDLVVICTAAGRMQLKPALGESVAYLVFPESFAQAVRVLRSAAFDVLYYWEVATDAWNYFLPFVRLAPVQCTSWGIQVTSGVPALDYYLSSVEVEPFDADVHYTETLLQSKALLSYQCRQVFTANVSSRANFGLAADCNLYVCVQQIGKFHPDFDAVLAGILRADRRALVVVAKDRWEYNAERLRARYQVAMPDVADRVVFLPRMSHETYLGLLSVADVVLDPFYYGGVNTTYDALSLGKAVVTMPGAFHIGRYASACVTRTGAAECIAHSPEDYVAKAVRIGTDGAFRRELEARILAGGEALFEDPAAVEEHRRLFMELIRIARS